MATVGLLVSKGSSSTRILICYTGNITHYLLTLIAIMYSMLAGSITDMQYAKVTELREDLMKKSWNSCYGSSRIYYGKLIAYAQTTSLSSAKSYATSLYDFIKQVQRGELEPPKPAEPQVKITKNLWTIE